uniref:Integrase catalytic domain-containing protein n=1 Tax=Denticeps clupeoides TaxID=299321 RepID=A0AAY4BPD3_9TELE
RCLLTLTCHFLDCLFSRWGLPNTITTDNGPQFTSMDFQTFLGDRGIRHTRTAFYHPEAGVERFNQTLKNGVRAHLADGLAFSSALQRTLLHYRSSLHSTTGVSPALLMLGRELQLPLDRLRPQPPLLTDWVRVRRPHRDNKLLSFWSEPVQITGQLGLATFRLADSTKWHASRLKKVSPPTHVDPYSMASDLDLVEVLPDDTRNCPVEAGGRTTSNCPTPTFSTVLEYRKMKNEERQKFSEGRNTVALKCKPHKQIENHKNKRHEHEHYQ